MSKCHSSWQLSQKDPTGTRGNRCFGREGVRIFLAVLEQRLSGMPTLEFHSSSSPKHTWVLSAGLVAGQVTKRIAGAYNPTFNCPHQYILVGSL